MKIVHLISLALVPGEEYPSRGMTALSIIFQTNVHIAK